MANIIEEFLNARYFNYAKTASITSNANTRTRHEEYRIDGTETIDGLALALTVSTVYIGSNTPVAQDFIIKSNRGVTKHSTVSDVFDVLRMFL